MRSPTICWPSDDHCTELPRKRFELELADAHGANDDRDAVCDVEDERRFAGKLLLGKRPDARVPDGGAGDRQRNVDPRRLLATGETNHVVRDRHVADVVLRRRKPPPGNAAKVAHAEHHFTVTIRRRTLSSPIVFIPLM